MYLIPIEPKSDGVEAYTVNSKLFRLVHVVAARDAAQHFLRKHFGDFHLVGHVFDLGDRYLDFTSLLDWFQFVECLFGAFYRVLFRSLDTVEEVSLGLQEDELLVGIFFFASTWCQASFFLQAMFFDTDWAAHCADLFLNASLYHLINWVKNILGARDVYVDQLAFLLDNLF